jgi:flagellar hook protein FlgE
MIDFSAPLSGMTQAETSVNQIATRLAKPAGDTVDVSSEMTSLMAARDSFSMDVKVAQTEDQMTQGALSLLA